MRKFNVTMNHHKYLPRKDFIYFLMLLVSGIICIYIIPAIKLAYYLTCLLIFFRTKKDYLWLCFIYIIMQSPGMLFDKPYDAFFNITSTVSISFVYIFIIIAFYKYRFYLKINLEKYIFKNIKIIFFYIIFLIIFSFIIGLSLKSLAYIFFLVVSILLYNIIPSILPNKLVLYKFISIMYFALIVLFIWQIYDTVFSRKIYSFFFQFPSDGINLGSSSDFELNRIFYSPGISLLSLYTSLFFLMAKNHSFFKKNYLFVIAGISFVSIFLTATRGYILQYSFIFLIFMLFNGGKAFKFVTYTAILLIAIILIFPVFRKQINLSAERFMTLESLYKGDVTAEGTLIRITDRAPRVWNKYIESPVVGFGYSSEGLEYNDDHVGNYTLLLQGGIVGMCIWIFVIFSIIHSMILKQRKSIKNNKLFYLTIAFIISLLIAHSTSSTVFTYYFDPHMIAIFGLFLIFVQRELYDVENNSMKKIY